MLLRLYDNVLFLENTHKYVLKIDIDILVQSV